ncbi:hypothetical protein DFR49_2319 [Hephaestia caeni]|uniref:Uncharacterized protein n=1 Tax=Hephaestia caeni TaxID=645617 RepID=A0A397P4A8_9SPHN|nr:hypothetical protein [Hephaestia caeni]RIA44082.1 hypothetical protein DFR49_2319 [Hephaestia caeni]
MTHEHRHLDVNGPARDRLREAFDACTDDLAAMYGALTWPQKATLLGAIVAAGDHPPGFSVRFDVSSITSAEHEYLRKLGAVPLAGDGA